MSGPAVAVTDEEVRSSILRLEHDALDEHQDLDFLLRKDEWRHLVKVLAAEPLRVTLLMGPKGSGKSNLLLHLKQKWQSRCKIRQVFAPFLLINLQECLITNLRDETYSTAAKGLYSALKSEVHTWIDMATSALLNWNGEHIGSIPTASIVSNLSSFSYNSRERVFSLIGLLDLLQEFLKQNSHVRPIIVLDEAHVLKSWCRFTTLSDEVHKLAQFFLWLSKDKGRGHVVMATSAPFFWSWVSETLEIKPLKMVPLGHFSETDAKNFVVNYVIPKYEGFLPAGGFNEGMWKSLYQVAGGSPHLLKIVVSDAVELGSWTDATESMVSTALEELRETLLELMRYEQSAHFEGIVGAIVNGGGLAGFDEVMIHVFSGDESMGRHVIKRLAEKSIVHVRLWTSGTKYMDVGEKRGNDTLYLMAADPSYFAAMKQLYPSWFNAAKKQDKKSTRNSRSKWVESGEDFSQGGSERDLEVSGGESDY